MSVTEKDWDRAREVVEPAVDEVANKVQAAGVHPGLLGAALVLAGANLVNENDGPGRAVRLMEGIIETLEAPPKRPALHVVGDEGKAIAGDTRLSAALCLRLV